MKKISLVLSCFLLFGCSISLNLPYRAEKIVVEASSNATTYTPISFDELSDKIENFANNFIVYSYSPSCSHCLKFIPKLEKAITNLQIQIYGYNVLDDINLLYRQYYTIPGTPCLTIFTSKDTYFNAVSEPKNPYREIYSNEKYLEQFFNENFIW
jgi:thiol-disulfide isomerase/thioredoxin